MNRSPSQGELRLIESEFVAADRGIRPSTVFYGQLKRPIRQLLPWCRDTPMRISPDNVRVDNCGMALA